MIHELLHVLTDPAHWIAEVVMDGTIMLVVAYPFRRLVARHDRRTHKLGVPNPDNGACDHDGECS